MKGVMNKLSSTFGSKKPKETKKPSTELRTRPPGYQGQSRIYTGTSITPNAPSRFRKDTQIPKPGARGVSIKEGYSLRILGDRTSKTPPRDSKLCKNKAEDRLYRDRISNASQMRISKSYKDTFEDNIYKDRIPKTSSEDDFKIYKDSFERDDKHESKTSETSPTDDSKVFVEFLEDIIIKETRPPPNTPKKLRATRIESDTLTGKKCDDVGGAGIDGYSNKYISGLSDEARELRSKEKSGVALGRALSLFQEESDDDTNVVKGLNITQLDKRGNFPIEKHKPETGNPAGKTSPYIEFPDGDKDISPGIRQGIKPLLSDRSPLPHEVTESPKDDLNNDYLFTIYDGSENKGEYLDDSLAKDYFTQREKSDAPYRQEPVNYNRKNNDANFSPDHRANFGSRPSNSYNAYSKYSNYPSDSPSRERVFREYYEEFLMDNDGADAYWDGAYCIYGSNEDMPPNIPDHPGRSYPTRDQSQTHERCVDDAFHPAYKRNIQPTHLNSDRLYQHQVAAGHRLDEQNMVSNESEKLYVRVPKDISTGRDLDNDLESAERTGRIDKPEQQPPYRSQNLSDCSKNFSNHPQGISERPQSPSDHSKNLSGRPQSPYEHSQNISERSQNQAIDDDTFPPDYKKNVSPFCQKDERYMQRYNKSGSDQHPEGEKTTKETNGDHTPGRTTRDNSTERDLGADQQSKERAGHYKTSTEYLPGHSRNQTSTFFKALDSLGRIIDDNKENPFRNRNENDKYGNQLADPTNTIELTRRSPQREIEGSSSSSQNNFRKSDNNSDSAKFEMRSDANQKINYRKGERILPIDHKNESTISTPADSIQNRILRRTERMPISEDGRIMDDYAEVIPEKSDRYVSEAHMTETINPTHQMNMFQNRILRRTNRYSLSEDGRIMEDCTDDLAKKSDRYGLDTHIIQNTNPTTTDNSTPRSILRRNDRDQPNSPETEIVNPPIQTPTSASPKSILKKNDRNQPSMIDTDTETLTVCKDPVPKPSPKSILKKTNRSVSDTYKTQSVNLSIPTEKIPKSILKRSDRYLAESYEPEWSDMNQPMEMTPDLSQGSQGSPNQQLSLFGRWMVAHGQLVDPNTFCLWSYATYPELYIDLSKFQMDFHGRWLDTKGRYVTPFFYCYSYDGEAVYLGDCDHYDVFSQNYYVDAGDGNEFANSLERYMDLSNFQMDMEERWMDRGRYIDPSIDWYDSDDSDEDDYYERCSLYTIPESVAMSLSTGTRNSYYQDFHDYLDDNIYSSRGNEMLPSGAYYTDYSTVDDYIYCDYPSGYVDYLDVATMHNQYLNTGNYCDEYYQTNNNYDEREESYSYDPRHYHSKRKTK